MIYGADKNYSMSLLGVWLADEISSFTKKSRHAIVSQISVIIHAASVSTGRIRKVRAAWS